MGNVRAARFDVPGRHKLCLNNLVQSNILVLHDQPSKPPDISVRCRVEDEVPGNAVQKNAEKLSRHDRRQDFSGKDCEKGQNLDCLGSQPSGIIAVGSNPNDGSDDESSHVVGRKSKGAGDYVNSGNNSKGFNSIQQSPTGYNGIRT